MTICELCRSDVPALVYSHVIPRSFYETYGRPGLAGRILGDGKPSSRSRTGVFAQFLCSGCEGKFNLWDDYACRLLRDAQPEAVGAHPSYYAFQGVNYERLKMFFLSVAWRAHACPMRTEIFGGFRLPEASAERLREVAWTGLVPSPSTFPVFVGKSNQAASHIVRAPELVSIQSEQFVKVYIPGYVFLIQLEEGPIPQSLFLFLLHTGTGLTAWHHDFGACGEAEEAMAVYLSHRENRAQKHAKST